MLTHPGSKTGPAWRCNLSDSLADPDRVRTEMMPFWALFILYLLAIVFLTQFITAIVAGVALGWRAMGGLAVGPAALGSLAVGRYAYAGNGVTYGAREARGRQKEHLLE